MLLRFLPFVIAVPLASSSCLAAADDLSIYAIDVGQGDSTLILGPTQDGERIALLVDAGDFHRSSTAPPNNAPRRFTDGAPLVEATLRLAAINRLDYVVLSHYDADHLGGFIQYRASRSLLWQYDRTARTCTPTTLFPEQAIIDIGKPVVDPEAMARRQWLDCVPQITRQHATARHIQVTSPAVLGRQLDLRGGYVATLVAGRGFVLGRPTSVDNADSPNEMSIAVLVSGPQGFDFLVTGDLIGVPRGETENAELEAALANALQEDTNLEVLRVGHHGAANATSPTLLDALDPEVAIISVGAAEQQGSNFRHPRCPTLRNLSDVDVVLQTGSGNHNCPDEPPGNPIVVNGTILVEVDEAGYSVRSLPNTSSAGLETVPFARDCTILDGCRPSSTD